VGFLVLTLWGRHPFWKSEAFTLSEAAAQRDAGEVARQLSAGADPNAPYLVRAGMLERESVMLTPIEAARMAGRDDIVAILVDAGASPRVPTPRAP
jgi:hypothetical protein